MKPIAPNRDVAVNAIYGVVAFDLRLMLGGFRG